jgi:hypothetical protein
MDDENRDSFEKISDALGTTFEQEAEPVTKELEVVQEKKSALTVSEDFGSVMFEDQEYLRNDLKDLIDSSKRVMAKLEQDIKIGANPRSHEVYSEMVSSTLRAYNELRELNKSMFDARFKVNGLKGGKKSTKSGDGTIELTAAQLSELMSKAKKDSSTNAIEVDFKVSEDKK